MKQSGFKETLVLGLVLLTAFWTEAVNAQDDGEVKAHYLKSEQMIAMRNGVRLFTSIYAPKDMLKKYPIMLHRTPYSVAPYGPGSL